MRQEERTRRKLVVVGDGGCGKTCMLLVFAHKRFPELYVPTIFDNYVADIEVNGREVELALWDTAGQEDFDRLRPLSYPDTDVLLVCYSIDSPDSLENVTEKWAPEIAHFCPRTPVILVGCKSDLRDDLKVIAELKQSGTRPLTKEEGADCASAIGALAHMECSAKGFASLDGGGISQVFSHATRAALAARCRKQRSCQLL